MKIIDMHEIEARHKGYWFSPETMRFWRTRLPQTGVELADGTSLFVSSERDFHGKLRLYTVRRQRVDGSIETVGEFQAYETRAQAQRAMKRFVNDLNV